LTENQQHMISEPDRRMSFLPKQTLQAQRRPNPRPHSRISAFEQN
jgi:hypothetical protein